MIKITIRKTLESSSNTRALSDYDGKAAILWKTFKDRMGKSDNIDMLFNIQELYASLSSDLFDSLEVPFSDKGIEDVIKELPNEKSPRPGGFYNEFMKCCWPIIYADVKLLIRDFCEEKINLENINDSFITLTRKIDSHVSSSDFRPISLLNSILNHKASCKHVTPQVSTLPGNATPTLNISQNQNKTINFSKVSFV
jgi:hypothetical protein